MDEELRERIEILVEQAESLLVSAKECREEQDIVELSDSLEGVSQLAIDISEAADNILDGFDTDVEEDA